MCEILFRGKRIDNDEWVFGRQLADDVIVPIGQPFEFEANTGFICSDLRCCDVGPETVGQYTGLTDKNGKKIFEGDIVKYGDTIHKVVFEQRNGTAYFGLVYNELETLPFGHYQDLKQIEVIGNIHDNPEILKGAEQ